MGTLGNMQLVTSPAGDLYVPVLDVSGWQLDYAGNGRLNPGADRPELGLAARQGIAGVIARVGNGTSLDESFALFAGAARDAGLPLGAYYYAQPNRLGPVEAADLVIAWLDNTAELAGHGELPVMLDLEEYHGTPLTPADLGAWVTAWLDRIAERDAGRRPIIYAGAAFANPRTVDADLSRWDTIQPRYARNYAVPPVDPADWANWIRWDREPLHTPTLGDWEGYQFTSSGHWPAYGGPLDAATDRVDLNIVHLAAWERWVGTNTNRPSWRPPMTALHMLEAEARIVDTRDDIGLTDVVNESTFVIDLGDLPDDAPDPFAAVVNITVVGPTRPGHVVLWGNEIANTSKLNAAAGQTIANTTLVNVGRTDGPDGRPVIRGMFRAGAGISARTDLIVDLIAVIG